MRPALGPPWGLRPRGSHTLGPVEGVGIQAEKQGFLFPAAGDRVFGLDTGETFSPVVSQLVAYRKLFCMNVLNGVVLLHLQDARPTREAACVTYLL